MRWEGFNNHRPIYTWLSIKFVQGSVRTMLQNPSIYSVSPTCIIAHLLPSLQVPSEWGHSNNIIICCQQVLIPISNESKSGQQGRVLIISHRAQQDTEFATPESTLSIHKSILWEEMRCYSFCWKLSCHICRGKKKPTKQTNKNKERKEETSTQKENTHTHTQSSTKSCQKVLDFWKYVHTHKHTLSLTDT